MTSIEWVKNADGSQGLTWNPIRGCTRVSPGCGGPGPHGGCYAEGIAARFSGPSQPYEGIAEMRGGKPRWTGKLAFVESALLLPLRRKKPTTWFVNSMSDLFHESVPDAWIDRVFAVMALAPQHTFQVLTKRSARMRDYLWADRRIERCAVVDELFPLRTDRSRLARDRLAQLTAPGHPAPLENVWLGVSAEDQRRADERVPDLLATPAAVRFVSAEPLLGPIDFTPWITPAAVHHHPDNVPSPHLDAFVSALRRQLAPRLDWLIVGGESGPGARPMHPSWARSIRDQCSAAGVAFHFKQHGAWLHETQGAFYPPASWFDAEGSPSGPNWHFWTDGDRGGDASVRVGKKVAGRLLDGVEHNGMPEARI